MLPFTHEQFLAVFVRYNTAVWPAQVAAYLLAALMLAALVARNRAAGRIVGAGLAVMWLWTGIAYHWLHFVDINAAAWLFGALFVVQALLMVHAVVVRHPLAFTPDGGIWAWLGWLLVVYAAVLYPLIGMATGDAYPAMPMFGITPYPVVVFTFGMFQLARDPIPRRLLVIPFVWSLIGGSAALLLRMPQDWVLLLSGFAVVPICRIGRAADHCARQS